MSVAHVNKTPGPLTGWTELPRKIVVMELVERVVVLALFVNFAITILGKGVGINVATALIVFAETLPILLVLSRGPSESLSLRPSDWLFGIAGTSAPLFALAIKTEPLVPLAVGVGFMVAGLFVQASSKVFLGRSFGIVAANRGVKVSGPYRIVRHPIYAGYTLTHIGFLLLFPCWQNLIIYTITLGLQIVRIMKEERVLSEDPAYRALMQTTRYRLMPGVF
ncbi:MAG TPA: isoprenylcysteine carboxylmethyltransferase family protein [Hyphomicrobiaceae bacterium]|nr:isoprenylcysteine carboxylmethyltransferase family protein [Hyphomicrobiaceae bacterium]